MIFTIIIITNDIIVLDKTFKGIRGVRHDNRKVFHALGSKTKCFECFLSIVQYHIIKRETVYVIDF